MKTHTTLAATAGLSGGVCGVATETADLDAEECTTSDFTVTYVIIRGQIPR